MNFVFSIAALAIAIFGCVLSIRFFFSQLTDGKISSMIEEKIVKEATASLKSFEEEEMVKKKVVMVIAHRNFRDEEFEEPRKILEKEGIEVIIASSSKDTATGMFGATAQPDILISELKVEDYDAIIFVGGSGASEYWNDPTAHKIAKEAVKQGKILGAICISPVTLANASVLEGKRATVWPSEIDKLKEKGALYTGEEVEIDGKIITASGPKAAEEFGKAILEALISSA